MNGIAEVAQQVLTVSDLNRARRPLADTVGVGAGAVACDNLDTGTPTEPIGQRFGLSVGQQVHDLTGFQIDQTSVAMAATPGPVIDGKYPRCRCKSVTDTVEAAIRKSVSALIGTATRSARRVPASPPRGSLQVTLQIAKPLGSASGNLDIIETLGESLANTVNVEATKPAGRRVDHHRSTVRWQITKLPHVIAMDAPRG